MISQLHIKNFKSIVDLTLDLGRVNLFIGENGCGKSNILEAVAFASEEEIDTIYNYPLVAKGVRVPDDPHLFCGAFEEQVENQEIDISFLVGKHNIQTKYWYTFLDEIGIDVNSWQDQVRGISDVDLVVFPLENKEYIKTPNLNKPLENFVKTIEFKENTSPKIIEEYNRLKSYFDFVHGGFLAKYMIYSPENSYLRKFDEEGQVKPLGSRGEGLFSLLKSLSKDNGNLQHIKEYLEAIDWFEDFSIPNDLMSNEYKIAIKDRFINSDLMQLDQRSANEGFLFLLFYVVLFSSKKTPPFFAVDNIEASFNPKLCAKLINMLVELSKKNEKQVLMTTHNPATLDGLNLNDPEQRLFVVKRNLEGHTVARRIVEKPKVSTPMKLSEMWTKGLLGGLPNNF